jgi:DNA-directed RNA polymerase specialized sigma24 family protein
LVIVTGSWEAANDMDEIGLAGAAPARGLSHGARRELAATLRAGRNDGHAVSALLAAYGSPLYDFIVLMVGPGQLASRVLTDTAVAVTGLARRLRDDDLLSAWVFALARQQCRRYPPVVWRARQWEELRGLATDGPVGRRDSVPVDLVRMAVLGIAPKDREVLLLSSTHCKLLSSDLAVVFGISEQEAAAAVADAHHRFEQALVLCAEVIGYRRDPRSRAPEIGELVGMALTGFDRRIPADQIRHTAQAAELAAYRQEVLSRIRLNERDGFPLAWSPEQAREHAAASRHLDEPRPRQPARPEADLDWPAEDRVPPSGVRAVRFRSGIGDGKIGSSL